MARILVTGSSDGIGLCAAQTLIKRGHEVHLHARNAERAAQTKAAVPDAASVIVGDISTIAGCKTFAAEANETANPFDIVIHNAGLGSKQAGLKNADGMGTLFVVNSLAPYILTALMGRPRRLIYTSSMLHSGGDGSLRDVTNASYGDSKLHNIMLANTIARRWIEVESNSVHPGWVISKLAGPSAPGSTQSGADTLVDLADPSLDKRVGTGQYYSGRKPTTPSRAATNVQKQDELIRIYEKLSGIEFPHA